MTNTKLRKETFDNQVQRVEGMLNTCGLNSYEAVEVLGEALKQAKLKYIEDEQLGRLDKWKKVMHKRGLKLKENKHRHQIIRLLTPLVVLLLSISFYNEFGLGLAFGWLICFIFTWLWEVLSI